MQLHNLKRSPQQLFDKDLLHQCKLWCKSGKMVILLMDANKQVLKGKFNKALTRTGLDMEEFTHKCWGPNQPYTHINVSIPIDGRYKSSEIEILNMCMLPFLDSPGDHQAFIIDISTRLLLGEFRYIPLGTLFPAPCPAPLQCALQRSSIALTDELILSAPSLQG